MKTNCLKRLNVNVCYFNDFFVNYSFTILYIMTNGFTFFLYNFIVIYKTIEQKNFVCIFYTFKMFASL